MSNIDPEQLVWRGRMEERVDEHGRRLDAINGNIGRFATEQANLRVEVANLKGAVGARAVIGSVLGSGAMALVGGIVLYVITQ